MKIDITVNQVYERYLRSNGTWSIESYMDALELAGFNIIGITTA